MTPRSFKKRCSQKSCKIQRKAPVPESHCVKSVRIWNFSGPHFLKFGLNTEIYRVYLCIQSKCEKTEDQRNSEYGHTFHAVSSLKLQTYNLQGFLSFFCWNTFLASFLAFQPTETLIYLLTLF